MSASITFHAHMLVVHAVHGETQLVSDPAVFGYLALLPLILCCVTKEIIT